MCDEVLLLNYHINFHQSYENHKGKICVQGVSKGKVYLDAVAEMVPYPRGLGYDRILPIQRLFSRIESQ